MTGFSRFSPGRIARGLHLAFGLVMIVVMLAPLVVAMPISFSSGSFLSYPLPGWSLQWYEKVFTPGPWLDSLRNSALIALAATVIATVTGTLAALAFARGGLPWPVFFLGVLIAPMIVPQVITGLGLYFAFSQIGLSATFTGVVIAHSLLATPFVLITVSASLQGFDFRLLQAAASLGASPLRGFFQVLVPIMAPGILSGALFAFATSFDEVVVTLFLAGPAQRTLPVRMLEGIRDTIDPSSLAISTVLTLGAALALLLAAFLLGGRSRKLAANGSEG